MPDVSELVIKEQVPLAPLTTIGLGGAARFFAECRTVVALREALSFARSQELPVHVLAGGSNTVFADSGYNGLVIKVALTGVIHEATGQCVDVTAQAGEDWDTLVAWSVRNNLAGVECLSGIPGTVGATPVQNVGAYGQDVATTIRKVQVLDRQTLKVVEMKHADCAFAYRSSRFKYQDKNRYLITEVTYRLRPDGEPTVVYPRLAEMLASHPTLLQVRQAVLDLRRRKSMVIDSSDPHSRSCGSFFMNPVLSSTDWRRLVQRCREAGCSSAVPSFNVAGGTKVPAAWLVEQTGFNKGERRGGVGISANHPLALVNYGGTSEELLALAQEIKQAVREQFDIELVREPVVVISN